MKTMAIIPARCKSVRVSHKNVRKLGGKPLIQWTIDAAKGSGLIDDILCCTDCEHIEGVKTIFPPAHDFINGEAVDAVVTTLECLPSKQMPSLVIMLLPTSPFRTAEMIDEAINAYLDDDANTLISVSPIDIESRKLRWVEDFFRVKRLRPLTSEMLCQSNGAIQIAKPGHLLKYKSFHAGTVMPYFMSSIDGMDIDTMSDLNKARGVVGSLDDGRRAQAGR